MNFASSPRSAVGIEWELRLIDRDSNDLRQAADRSAKTHAGCRHLDDQR